MQALSGQSRIDHNGASQSWLAGFREGFPEHLREAISSFLFLEETAGSFDLAVCLGCTCYGRSAARGIRLYQSGRCRTLLFTGGPNPKIGGNEALLMARLALEAGIPITDVLVDPCATNTFENCLGVRDILQRRNGIIGVADTLTRERPSLAFISIHYHSRRACETYRMISGDTILPSAIPYSSSFYTANNWHLSEHGRRDVFRELSRMDAYFPEYHCPELRFLLNSIRERI